MTKPYKKASRESKAENTVVTVGNVSFGDGSPVIIAGPCAVESEEQIITIAKGVKAAGAHMLRGGAFKPRTSPYSFQGLGEDGIELLAKAREATDLPIVTELLSTDHLNLFAEHVDMIQIGSRNMDNYDLLKKAARLQKPILLKRGMAATVEEFLCAAEYILNEGNGQVVLCERGIRTFATECHSGPRSGIYTEPGNILDLNGLLLIKQLSHLPIIADPSHAAGRADLVPSLSRASLSSGADGLIIEVHHKPAEALSDGQQSLTLEEFEGLMKEL